MDLTKVIISSFFLIGSFSLTAQNISGVIVDSETKEPLENVNIYLKNSAVGTESDTDGKWSLENSTTKGSILFFSLLKNSEYNFYFRIRGEEHRQIQ